MIALLPPVLTGPAQILTEENSEMDTRVITCPSFSIQEIHAKRPITIGNCWHYEKSVTVVLIEGSGSVSWVHIDENDCAFCEPILQPLVASHYVTIPAGVAYKIEIEANSRINIASSSPLLEEDTEIMQLK